MNTPRRSARSSVLGKRTHAATERSSPIPTPLEGDDKTVFGSALPTPDGTPKLKRARTLTATVEDGHNNKENIPPSLLNSPSAGFSRMLRRSSTELSSVRTAATPRRTGSSLSVTSNTPSTALAGLHLSTPPATPPSILIPLHVRARALLRATCNSIHQYAGREQERSVLVSFFTTFLLGSGDAAGDVHSALYVSGLPGTGKTALVHDVLHNLGHQDARILFINCMALGDVDALWERLLEEFHSSSKPVRKPGRGKMLKGLKAVESVLNDQAAQCIIILDEVDHIAKNSEILSAVFSLSRAHSATLRVVGIANTHTLTSVSSVSTHVQTLHFSAYTSTQLQEIIQLRLASLAEGDDEDNTVAAAALKKFLPPSALNLLTKKIATQTGDVRALFEVLRGAIDKATAGSSFSESPAVTPAHILAALKAHAPAASSGRGVINTVVSSDMLPSISSNASVPIGIVTSVPASEYVLKVRNLGLHARLVLLAFLLALHRLESGLALSGTGFTHSNTTTTTPRRSPVKRSQSAITTEGSTPRIDSAQLHSFYSAILARSGDAFVPVSRTEFADLLSVLDTVGLITLTGSAAVVTAAPAGGKGRRVFGRSNSFAAVSGAKAGARAQELCLSSGARTDELLRGLGCSSVVATTDGASADVAEEETRALYERERARAAREVKARAANVDTDTFAEAIED